MTNIESLTMGIYEMIARPAMPIIGMFVVFGALYLIVKIDKHKHQIKQAFEVQPLTAEEVKEFIEESNQGELVNKREGLKA